MLREELNHDEHGGVEIKNLKSQIARIAIERQVWWTTDATCTVLTCNPPEMLSDILEHSRAVAVAMRLCKIITA
jgi:hypothetical protein